MVWLACWDCMAPSVANRGSMVDYAPSSAPLPTSDGSEIVGQFATLAIGSAVFQVFSVDFVEAEIRKAVVWNPDPPDSIADAVPLIWPHRLRAGDIAWPHPPSRMTALTGWPIGTWRCAAELPELAGPRTQTSRSELSAWEGCRDPLLCLHGPGRARCRCIRQ